jgi:hypothetical protein
MKLEILESANNQHICSSQNESQISHKNYKDFKTKYISKNKNKIKGVSRHGAKKKNRKVQ